MSDEKNEYDNRVSAWLSPRKVGEAQGFIGGMKVYGYVIPTGREKGPKYEAFLNNKEGSFVIRIGLFEDTKFEGLMASGSVDAAEYGSYWVSMRRVDSENSKAPDVSLAFKERSASKERNTEEKPKHTAFDSNAVSGADLVPADNVGDVEDLPF